MATMFDSLKRMSDIPVKKNVVRPMWMPIGNLSKNNNRLVELYIPPNPYVIYKAGNRSLFYKQADKHDYTCIGNAGAKLDLVFGKKVYSQVVRRTFDAPSFEGMADLGSSVNYFPELIDNFWLQHIIGMIWDSGFSMDNLQVVKFVIPNCPQSILDAAYNRHFKTALSLGLTVPTMFDNPKFVEVKSRFASHVRTLRIVNEIHAGEKEVNHFEGIISVDKSNNVNYLALCEAKFSDKELDFHNLRAFDCEGFSINGLYQNLYRDIYMDEEMIFHPDSGEISSPEWVFVNGLPLRNPSNDPIKCTPVLQECLRAELHLPLIY